MAFHNIRLESLKVGDEVAALSSAGFHGLRVAGYFQVIKADKLKVILQRKGDEHTMQFSVKTGKQWCEYKGAYDDGYGSLFLDTVERANEIKARQNHVAAMNNAWRELEKAVESKNIEQIKEMLAQVEQLNKGE